jgi:hypothetical protein
MEPLHAVIERARTLAGSYFLGWSTFTVMNEAGGDASARQLRSLAV